jgi:hypothetical protein
MAQRLADPARQVDVGGLYHDGAVPLLDSHDAVQRVLGLSSPRWRAVHDLVLVAPTKSPVRGDPAAG